MTLSIYHISLLTILAILISYITHISFSFTKEGFNTEAPIDKAKSLLKYISFEGNGDSMLMRINTPGGLRLEDGKLIITNADDTKAFSGKAGGLVMTTQSIDTDIMSHPNGKGVTWSIMPDTNGILSASSTTNNPINTNTEYLSIFGHKRSLKDGTYVKPAM